MPFWTIAKKQVTLPRPLRVLFPPCCESAPDIFRVPRYFGIFSLQVCKHDQPTSQFAEEARASFWRTWHAAWNASTKWWSRIWVCHMQRATTRCSPRSTQCAPAHVDPTRLGVRRGNNPCGLCTRELLASAKRSRVQKRLWRIPQNACCSNHWYEYLCQRELHASGLQFT